MPASAAPSLTGCDDDLPPEMLENGDGARQSLPIPNTKKFVCDQVMEVTRGNQDVGGTNRPKEAICTIMPTGTSKTRPGKSATEETWPGVTGADTSSKDTAKEAGVFGRREGSHCFCASSMPKRISQTRSPLSLCPSGSSHSSPGAMPQRSPRPLDAFPFGDVVHEERAAGCTSPMIPAPAMCPSLSFLSSPSSSSSHSSAKDGSESQSGARRNADPTDPHLLACSTGEEQCGRTFLSAIGGFSLASPLFTAEDPTVPFATNAELWLPALQEPFGVQTPSVQTAASIPSWQENGERDAEKPAVLHTRCFRGYEEERLCEVGIQASVPDRASALFSLQTKGLGCVQAFEEDDKAARPNLEIRLPPSDCRDECLWEGLFGGGAREASVWLVKHLLWAERAEQLKAELSGTFRCPSSQSQLGEGLSHRRVFFSCFPLWKNIATRRQKSDDREECLFSPILSVLFAVNTRTFTSLLTLPCLAAWEEKIFFSAFTSADSHSKVSAWSSFFYGEEDGRVQKSQSPCRSCHSHSPAPFLPSGAIRHPVAASLRYFSQTLLARCELLSKWCKYNLAGFQGMHGLRQKRHSFVDLFRVYREVFCRLLLLHSTAVAVAWGRHIHFDWKADSNAPTPRHKELPRLALLCLELCRQQGEIRNLQGSISHKLRQQHEAVTRSRLLDVLCAAAAGDERTTPNGREVFPFFCVSRGPPEDDQNGRREKEVMNEAEFINSSDKDDSELQAAFGWLAAQVFMCDSQVYLHLPADHPVSRGLVPAMQEVPSTTERMQEVCFLDETCSAANVLDRGVRRTDQDGVAATTRRLTPLCGSWTRPRDIQSEREVTGSEIESNHVNDSTADACRNFQLCHSRELQLSCSFCPASRGGNLNPGDKENIVHPVLPWIATGCILDLVGQSRSSVGVIRAAILLPRTTFRHFFCYRAAVPTDGDASEKSPRETGVPCTLREALRMRDDNGDDSCGRRRDLQPASVFVCAFLENGRVTLNGRLVSFPTTSSQCPLYPQIVDVLVFSWFGTGRRPAPPSLEGTRCSSPPVSRSASPPCSPSCPVSCNVTAPQQRFTLLFLAADGRLFASGDIPPFLVRTSPLSVTLTKGRLGSFFHAHPIDAVCTHTGRHLLFSAFLAANAEGAALTSGLVLPRYRLLQGSASGDMLMSHIPACCSSAACSHFPSPYGVSSSSSRMRWKAHADATAETVDNDAMSSRLRWRRDLVHDSVQPSVALFRGSSATNTFQSEREPLTACTGRAGTGWASASFWPGVSDSESCSFTDDRQHHYCSVKDKTFPCALAILQSHTGDPVLLQMAFENPKMPGTHLQSTGACRPALIQGIGGVREYSPVALEFVSLELVGRGRDHRDLVAATSFKEETVDRKGNKEEGRHKNTEGGAEGHASQGTPASTRAQGGAVQDRPAGGLPSSSILKHLLESERWVACCLYHIVLLVKTGVDTPEGGILLSTLEKKQHDWLASFFVEYPLIRASIRSLRLGFEHLTSSQNDRIRQKLLTSVPKADAVPQRLNCTSTVHSFDANLRGRSGRRGRNSFLVSNEKTEGAEEQVDHKTREHAYSAADVNKCERKNGGHPPESTKPAVANQFASNGDNSRDSRRRNVQRIRALVDWEEGDSQLRLFIFLVDGTFFSVNLHQKRVELVWNPKRCTPVE
ncbi:hypothetical protein TGMAS_304880 [Toxoplasma gondii MAS]|uniref:Uncharacterized protein n=2 Tax=Toxoplasma gondii TaxID=5811 RepID=A0A086Q2U9_TOXGO|nr:hypothetical protein TGMAS_304880 [Toxoplasma gondii MAS]PUA85947.1 hypothetical protein TGBR9_304880 [Toxoplasma gondii TgCATBr9]